MSHLQCIILLVALAAGAHSEILFTDSFEGPSPVAWGSSWGPAERTQEHAHDGQWAVKETLEDKHGLSVWWTVFDGYPNTTYRASAWVYIPADQKKTAASLAFTHVGSWAIVASASTAEVGEWVKLETVYENTSGRRMRLQLFQEGQAAGLGGCVMYWDSVVVEREIGAINVADGIRSNPYVIEGLDVTPAGGMKVKVAPGKLNVDGTPVEVSREVTLEVALPRIIHVRDEAARLTDDQPQGYGKGTALKACVGTGVSAAGCLDPESLVIKLEKGPEGERLLEGVHWRADKTWGRVGRLPQGPLDADTVVYMDYDVSLMRLDTIQVNSAGEVLLRRGGQHKTVPEPPKVDMYARGLCNVFIPYHCKEIAPELIYPLGPPFPSPAQAEVQTNTATIPNSLEKLSTGDEFTLLFWGDSVTCGGDAGSQATAFPSAFTAWLRNKYPQANIKYVNAGTGGWNSASKLPLFEEEVIAHEPDLVIIEFVNDMGMDRDMIFANYTQAVSRIRQVGGEVIILTPHFVRPDWMQGGGDMRTAETRAAVGYLKEFALESNVGLADASRRWAHLWVEGIPYMTFLRNTINHPEDRGHWLFVEELQKFFP